MNLWLSRSAGQYLGTLRNSVENPSCLLEIHVSTPLSWHAIALLYVSVLVITSASPGGLGSPFLSSHISSMTSVVPLKSLTNALPQ